MNLKENINSRRTIRSFNRIAVSEKLLLELVDYARVAPSGSNMQSLKYCIVTKEEDVITVFKNSKYAGYLEWNPTINERAEAFIIVLNDLNIRKTMYELDAGAAIQNILLGANEMGLSTCWLGSIHRENIKKFLNIPTDLIIVSAIAIGYSNEKSVIEDKIDHIKYYKDEKDIVHVPKRSLEEITILR